MRRRAQLHVVAAALACLALVSLPEVERRSVAAGGGTTTLRAVVRAHLPVLRTLGTRPWFGPRLIVSGAKDVFDPDGRLVDEQVRAQLVTFMAGFATFIGDGA